MHLRLVIAGELAPDAGAGTMGSGTDHFIMASDHRQGASNGGGNDGGRHDGAPRRPPEWADGLKQLYDSVVEEALPDSFKDLLDQLDAMDPARGKTGGADAARGSRDTNQ
jgi:hypothetical protein